VTVAVLVALYVPEGGSGRLTKGQLTQTLNNARQIHLATLRMTTDAAVEPNPKLGWPGDLPDVKSLGDFVERLVEYKYMDRGDIKSLFHAPGVKAYGGTGPFSSENSAFKIYKARNADVGEVIYISTNNFTLGQPLDANAVPYGKKGAVIFRKSGEGVIINDRQATHSANGNLGLNVGGTSLENVGAPSPPLL
jgi:hypothetical protein